MSDNIPYSRPTRRLARQPSLEQLKKQAKDLLYRYKAGDASAIAEVRQFESEPDPLSFALNDAHRVLARAYGYESWTKLKVFVDGVSVRKLAEAVKAGDIAHVRKLLHARPELVGMDLAENDEHRALHFAVLRRDLAMVQLLMEAGADARKGIFPHRDATSALALARDRGYEDVVSIIEEEERLRREELSCPNATVSPVQDEISAAILQGYRAKAIRLLEANRSFIHACDREGRTPLHVAAQASDKEMVAWLLERRADIRKVDMHGFTALDRAALSAGPRNESAERFPAVARLLLQYGAEMTVRAGVALGDLSRVYEFIKTNPDLLRQIDRNGGLLSLAVNHNKIEIARLLLDLGADVDEKVTLHELEEPTLSWGAPLWYAALAGQRDIVELLLDRGADPNANVYASGWPLRNAWNHPDDSVKRLLLERGAKPQPYMIAEAHNFVEANRMLDANPSEELASEFAWSAADHGCPEIVELALPLLQWPANDPRWHWILIQPIRGAGSEASQNAGHFAAMEALLRHGIDVNVSRYGQTTLHFAAAYHGEVGDRDRARFAGMLLDHGARLDLRDDMLKSTPLGWACRWGRTQMAELLIARGAPADEPDAEAWATPKAWAEKMQRVDVLAVLREHEARE